MGTRKGRLEACVRQLWDYAQESKEDQEGTAKPIRDPSEEEILADVQMCATVGFDLVNKGLIIFNPDFGSHTCAVSMTKMLAVAEEKILPSIQRQLMASLEHFAAKTLRIVKLNTSED